MSHPAWVCGLKPSVFAVLSDYSKSHPAWVCGLKQGVHLFAKLAVVTPCVGVWIETKDYSYEIKDTGVTPCVGVWIETVNQLYRQRD